MTGRGGERAALVAALAVTLAALLRLLPAPTYALWYAHVVALETGLGWAILGLGAAVACSVALGGAKRRRAPLILAILSFASASVGLVDSARGWLALRDAQASFSLVEYLGLGRAPDGPVDRDVALDASRPELRVDIHHGAGTGPRPFVVLVHGGSWRGGDKGAGAPVTAALAASGWTVVDVRYRLAPQHRFPAAVADVKCALGRVRERAASLGIDAGRAVLLGRSAGGEVALVAAYSAGDARLAPSCAATDAPVQGVVAIYSPTDLAWGHDNPMRPDVVRGPESLELYLGGPPGVVPDAYRLATPQSWVAGLVPPTLLVHGGEDRFVSVGHMPRLARALAEAGRSVRTVEVPAADHGFDIRWGGFGEQLARAEILRFLAPIAGPASDTIRP